MRRIWLVLNLWVCKQLIIDIRFWRCIFKIHLFFYQVNRFKKKIWEAQENTHAIMKTKAGKIAGFSNKKSYKEGKDIIVFTSAIGA